MNGAQESVFSRSVYFGVALMVVVSACATSYQDEARLSYPSRPTYQSVREETEKGSPYRYRSPWSGGERLVLPGDSDYDELWPYRIKN